MGAGMISSLSIVTGTMISAGRRTRALLSAQSAPA